MTIRTRFAPSPTGYLHIGGVRTALFNWLLAKQSGGQFLLRIDDTDAQRNVAQALEPILSGFRWLGIDWDEGPTPDGQCSVGPYAPYFQSQRLQHYQQAVEQLLASGHAYRDFAKPEELAAEREQAEKAGTTFIYDRRWMATTEQQAQEFASQGRTGVVRLKMPREGVCTFVDLVRGPVEFQWAAEQDHVIQRADGTCLYHLASVVDDFAMQISHVVRAVEHLSNTPRQIYIAQSLGYPLPIYAHLPFVAEPSGTAKLSKRKLANYLKNKDFAALFQLGQQIASQAHLPTNPETFNPVIVDFYRSIGFLPEAILNYLLLLGWSLDDSREEFTREQMIQLFTLDRINKAPASFDPAKLIAFQSRWMNGLPMDRKVQLCLPFLQSANLIVTSPDSQTLERVANVIQAAGDRIKVAGDILSYSAFFVSDDRLDWNADDFDKRLRKDSPAVNYLRRLVPVLKALPQFDAATVEQSINQFMEAEGIKFKQIIHALRVAVTGQSVGFGMFDAISILGKNSCLERIERAIALCDSENP